MNQAEIKHYEIIIVGAGISGIAAAIRLQQAGLNNFKIIERAERVGGTWRDNTYPGCGCDVPSALYSYSFAPSHEWSRLFARQPEILDYLENVSASYDVYRHIDFNTPLERAEWDKAANLWRMQTPAGEYQAQHVIFATGPITEPKIPELPGLKDFRGEMFHSARWNHDYDLTGKRVAVIGTGASAIQFIPQIQPQVESLVVFQRTPPWVLPKPDMTLGVTSQWLSRTLPALQRRWRAAVAQTLRLINVGLRNPGLMEPFNQAARQLLKMQVHDPQLRAALTPRYTLGCKRILFANDYYPALQADNTTLIPHALASVEGNTVIAANGERHEVDVIIWGTGFEVSHPPIGRAIINEQGQCLADLWQTQSPEAFLGTAIESVPNAFLMLGPNVLVYDSFIRLAEAQLDYIVSAIKTVKERRISRYRISPIVIKKHNEQVQRALQSTVFNSGGCSSYYLDEHGRNFAAWPWSLARLKRRLRAFSLADYETRMHAAS